jgi:hypothetical protein
MVNRVENTRVKFAEWVTLANGKGRKILGRHMQRHFLGENIFGKLLKN